MTGLGWNGSYLYGATTYSSPGGCYRFAFSGTAFTTKSTYIDNFADNPSGYDITYQIDNASTWMATDNATSPVVNYEQTSGGILQMLPSSIGIGSSCRGLAFETGSSRYIWVSNVSTNELYRVDLGTTALEQESPVETAGALQLSCSRNPFAGSVILQSEYSQEGTVLEIFDLSGRSVLHSDFNGSLIWNTDTVPSGTYIARIRGGDGASSTLLLTKL